MTIDEIYKMREYLDLLHAEAVSAWNKKNLTAWDITNARIRRLQEKYTAAIETYLDETDGPHSK